MALRARMQLVVSEGEVTGEEAVELRLPEND
jgi:hypothetical protein